MTDEMRAAARRLAKGISGAWYPGNTKLFAGATPTPWGDRALNRTIGIASARRNVAGNGAARASLLGQASSAVARGKFSATKAIGKLNTSLSRPVGTVTHIPSAPGGNSGGAGYSGAPSYQLGVAPTAGSAAVSAVAHPNEPTPLNQN